MRNSTYARSHTYKTPLPMTIGMEGAGTVTALGKASANSRSGTASDFALSAAAMPNPSMCRRGKRSEFPDAVPFPVAAALMLQGSTAHYLSHSAFPLAPGTHLSHSRRGRRRRRSFLIQLAKLRGARVLTTVADADKASKARECGADETILYRMSIFASRWMRLHRRMAASTWSTIPWGATPSTAASAV